MRNSFFVTLDSHSGCSPIPTAADDRAEARKAAADWIRAARAKGRRVTTLRRGTEWEIEEQEEAAMIGDKCGILSIAPPLAAACCECGCEFTPETCDDRGDGRPTLGAAHGGRWMRCEECANPTADDDDENCAGCGCLIGDGGDGWDGRCADCADEADDDDEAAGLECRTCGADLPADARAEAACDRFCSPRCADDDDVPASEAAGFRIGEPGAPTAAADEAAPIAPPDVVGRIARDVLGVPTLEARNSDSLDFHDLGVWSIRAALEAAFEAGRCAKCADARERNDR